MEDHPPHCDNSYKMKKKKKQLMNGMKFVSKRRSKMIKDPNREDKRNAKQKMQKQKGANMMKALQCEKPKESSL